MKIELKAIKVSALTNGYEDNEEDGVVGFLSAELTNIISNKKASLSNSLV